MALTPRESGEYISKIAKHVTVKSEGIEKLGNQLVKEINSGRLSVENFSQNAIHPQPENPDSVDWLFVVDTLNFCFWSLENEEGWTVDGYTGYFALCAAINRAVQEKVDILNPHVYSTISEEQLKKVLRSDSNAEIPLFKERIASLHEVGSALIENFEGTFRNVVKKADNSAVKLLQLIVDNFPCFRDEAVYKGTKVTIYKRAQILVADIWSCYRNEGLGHFKDIEEITMFADYRVPQSLLYYGVFEYSEALLKKLNAWTILENGEEMEVEIRGASIYAVELLAKYVKKNIDANRTVNSILIDHFLWDFRRKHAQEILHKKFPFHKTFCIYY